MLRNTPNHGFILQEPATIKKIEQLLEKKNLEEGILRMEKKSPEKNTDDKDNQTYNSVASSDCEGLWRNFLEST